MGPTIDTTVAELERQIERGSQFTQAVAQRGSQRIGQAEFTLAGLLRVLETKGIVSADELESAFEMPEAPEASDGADEAEAAPPSVGWPTIALRSDDDAEPDGGAVVDCASRLHVCESVCCRLRFALSPEEIDAGKVRWDLGHPYVIRHDATGSCVHISEGRCAVYDDRPRVCRKYDCTNDHRIWKDFDAMVLNDEWIAEHLGPRDISIGAVVPLMERVDD